MMEQKRSAGVTVAGVFIIIISILAIPIQLPYFITTFQQPIGKEVKEQVGTSTTLKEYERETRSLTIRHMRGAATRRIVYAVIFLMSGIGIIKRKNWCRLLFVIMVGIIVLSSISDRILYKPALDESVQSISFYIISSSILLISLFYFTRPKVKEQFRQ